MYEGTEAFFKEYQEKARRRRRPLVYYLGVGLRAIPDPEQAIKAANSFDDDKICRRSAEGEFQDREGPIKFGAKGEWPKVG